MPPKKSQPKKKKAAGPQRGFATTSVPKKVIETEAAAPEEAVAQEVTTGDVGVNGGGVEGGGEGKGLNGVVGGEQAEAVRDGEGWDEAGIEEHQLQALADKIRPGSDKEIARIAKVRNDCIGDWPVR